LSLGNSGSPQNDGAASNAVMASVLNVIVYVRFWHKADMARLSLQMSAFGGEADVAK